MRIGICTKIIIFSEVGLVTDNTTSIELEWKTLECQKQNNSRKDNTERQNMDSPVT
jgi:hypothetical protein